MPCFKSPALQSPPASPFMVQTLSSLVPVHVPPPTGVFAPSISANIAEDYLDLGVSAPSVSANTAEDDLDLGISVPSAITNIISSYHFLGVSVSPPYKGDIVQETDSKTLNSIYIFLTPSFTPHSDVQYVEVYEDERLYATVADEMVDECMVYYHCGVLYNVPARSAKDGVHPPFFIVTCGRHIGVFCGWQSLAPMIEGIRHAVYAEADSIEEGERAVRSAIERGDIVRFQ
ncbi:hypothetical protein DFJ58DRAFT_721185 [Suillus subalutaceus]|uniref:uncharacterized protein n=1 Tax=Suillus subalutaceus TaxID=48586 RepID=UPI001B87D0CA|nr:uncharacterized protein DFJ58DRAFT_721185 [Suillus subalutaceus]KAG1876721.1 hypothetical protein DFJ58DRAFT_721185 [Suillus subalutaceus]